MNLMPLLLLAALAVGLQESRPAGLDESPAAQAPGSAGGQRGEGAPPAGDVRPNMSPAEIQRIFDAYLIVQAQDALGLSEAQFAQFLSRLRALQNTRRVHQQERMRIIQELQRLTNPRNPNPGDEPTIRERLKALHDVESRSATEIRKAYTAVDEVLDARQQARFRVFEEQIERKKLDLLIRARQTPTRPNQLAPRRPPG